MGKWLLSACVALLGATLVATEVEARRLGGARSVGAQRNVTAPPAQTPAKPAQQQALPAQAAQQPAAAPSGLSRWMPLLGGLALGGLLGYLFGGSGLVGILLLAALAIGAVLVIRALAHRRAAEPARPLQFAGMGGESVVAPPPQAAALQTAQIPAGFDAAGFLRGAKLNFVKLQIANDRGQLDEIREFTTQEMFEELKKDVLERGAGAQQTDVASLEAELLELATENDRHWAAVRFCGTVREAPGAEPVAFEEVWNLAKPVDGSSGWLLAGIQQMH